MNVIRTFIHNRKRARSDSPGFNLSSTIADLAAAPRGFAAGVERRLDHGISGPEPLVATGRANGGAVTHGPNSGGYAVNEAYLEFDIPRVSDVPFARQQAVNLAKRHSDYSSLGSTDNSRVGLRWKPTRDRLIGSTWAPGITRARYF
ncbi:MAG TPA: hypothetical protein VFN13_07115 [Rudaea sp.]|nr:hypothetical protein [Rudaea sp.]